MERVALQAPWWLEGVEESDSGIDTNTTTPLPHLRARASASLGYPDEGYQDGPEVAYLEAGSQVRASDGMMQVCRIPSSTGLSHGRR